MPIAPWVLPAAGVGGTLLLISSVGKGEVEDVPSGSEPALQSIRRAHPETGQPIQIVVPVTTAMPQVSESVVPIAGPVRDNHGAGARYVPRPVLVRSPNSTNILRLAPMVISPHGASTLAVETMSDVQNAVNTLGFGPIAVTGKFNPATSVAVNNFQRAHGYLATGAVDGQTMSQVQDALAHLAGTVAHIGAHPDVQTAVGPIAPIPGSGAQIASMLDVQHALNLLGASPSLVEDGREGPKTMAAVVAFQIAHGLTGDGKPGPMTKAALGQALATPGGQAAMNGDPMEADPMIRDYVFWTAPNGIRMAYDPADMLPIRSVIDVQAALVNLGFPSLATSGTLDGATKAAVRTLQTKYGLSADGIPGPKTRTLLARVLAQAKTNAVSSGASMAGDFFQYGTHWPYGGGDFGRGSSGSHGQKKHKHHRPQPPPPPDDDSDMGGDFGIGVVIPSQYSRPHAQAAADDAEIGCAMGFGFGAEGGPALLNVPASPANAPVGLPIPGAAYPHGMTSPVPPSVTYAQNIVSGAPQAAHGDFSSSPAPNSTRPLIGVVGAPAAVGPIVHPAAAATAVLAGLSGVPAGAAAAMLTAGNAPPSAAGMARAGDFTPPSSAVSSAGVGVRFPLASPSVQTMPNLGAGLPGSLGAAPAVAVDVPAFPGEEVPGAPNPWYPVPVSEPTVDFGFGSMGYGRQGHQGYGSQGQGMGMGMHHRHHHHHRQQMLAQQQAMMAQQQQAAMAPPAPPMDDGSGDDGGADIGWGPTAQRGIHRPLPPGYNVPPIGYRYPVGHALYGQVYRGPQDLDRYRRWAIEHARRRALEAARLNRMRQLAQLQAQSADDAAAQDTMMDQGSAPPLVAPPPPDDDDSDDAGADTGFGFGFDANFMQGMVGQGGAGSYPPPGGADRFHHRMQHDDRRGGQGGGPGGEIRPSPQGHNTWERWLQYHPGDPYSAYQAWWNQWGKTGATIGAETTKHGGSMHHRAPPSRAFG